ncbi:small acid-soluble spore protein H [Bacillus sp. JJ1764]|uniref:small acid-soluble spore protein H n=1 Tax=Bacillus sp. JJ1764 TaxID=3122964 RepID=UPI00300017B4
MDAQRAQEICNSNTMANVICNGRQIYIEHVDQERGLATIHPLDEPNNKQNVSITNLIEQ